MDSATEYGVAPAVIIIIERKRCWNPVDPVDSFSGRERRACRRSFSWAQGEVKSTPEYIYRASNLLQYEGPVLSIASRLKQLSLLQRTGHPFDSNITTASSSLLSGSIVEELGVSGHLSILRPVSTIIKHRLYWPPRFKYNTSQPSQPPWDFVLFFSLPGYLDSDVHL